jgi:chromatin remodeling complex protein RSC6
MPPAKNTTKAAKAPKGTGPKKEKKDKKVSKNPPKKVIKEKAPPVEKPAPVEPSAPVEQPDVPESVAEFANVLTEIESALVTLRAMKTRVQKLEKQVQRERKVLEKAAKGKRKRVVDPNAEPAGFAKPGPVSPALAKFLGLKKGELIARTGVTKRINAYCKENGLQKESDKRTILPDKKLGDLLNVKKGDDVTFFNLQTYMKVHFPNKEGVYPTL